MRIIMLEWGAATWRGMWRTSYSRFWTRLLGYSQVWCSDCLWFIRDFGWHMMAWYVASLPGWEDWCSKDLEEGGRQDQHRETCWNPSRRWGRTDITLHMFCQGSALLWGHWMMCCGLSVCHHSVSCGWTSCLPLASGFLSSWPVRQIHWSWCESSPRSLEQQSCTDWRYLEMLDSSIAVTNCLCDWGSRV